MQFQRPALFTTLSLSLLCGAMPAIFNGVATLRAAPETSPPRVEKEDGSTPTSAPVLAPDEHKATSPSDPSAPLPQSDSTVASRVIIELEGARFLSYSLDGNTIAAASGASIYGIYRGGNNSESRGKDGVEIRSWNAKSDKIMSSSLQTKGRALQVAFSPDLARVAASLWEPSGGRGKGQSIAGLGISVWTVKTGKLIHTFSKELSAVTYGGNSLSFSPDGKQLAASFDSGVAKLWDVAGTKKPYVWQPKKIGDEASVVAFSPNGWNLAVGRVVTTISIHDTRGGEKWRELERNGNIRRLAFSPDNSLLASGAGMWTPVNGADKPWEERGGETQIWNMKTGSMLRTLPEERFLRAIAWSSDNRYLTTVTYDDESHGNPRGDLIKIWDAQHAKLLKTISDVGGIQVIAFPPVAKANAPTGSIQFATITVAGQVKLWVVKGLEVEE